MNPPYHRDLHLQVLQAAMSINPKADIVNLSPVRWLQDPLAEYKKNSDWEKFSDIREHLSFVEVIHAIAAIKAFGASFHSSLAIYTIIRKSSHHYQDLRDFISMKIYNSGCYYKKFDINKKDGWRTKISVIDNTNTRENRKRQKVLYFYDGKKDGRPWYSFYQRNKHTKNTDGITFSLAFNSEDEAINFVNVYKSKLSCYYYRHMIVGTNVYAYFFLKLDFSHPWTDEMLYKHFNLTEDEISKIESYYDFIKVKE